MEFVPDGTPTLEIEEISSSTVKIEAAKVRVALPEGKRSAVVNDARVESSHADSDNDGDGDAKVAQEDIPPAERNISPKDVIEFTDEDEIIYIIGTWGGKVTRIAGLEKMSKIKDLVLRSCLVGSMDGIEDLSTLRKLELYDNQIEQISGLEKLSNLRILDLSFNAIRCMIPDLAQFCPLLEGLTPQILPTSHTLLHCASELYIAQNKLRKIEGLEGLSHLRVLDLGANRIRSMDGLESLSSLQSLWLGKNKIEEVGGGINNLIHLRQLDIQNNRLTTIGTLLLPLENMSELYLACNALPDVSGLPKSLRLNTVDLSSNPLTSLEGIEEHTSIEELWMTKSGLETFQSLEPLRALTSLTCVYLEHSPVAKEPDYKANLVALVPTLRQLDAVLLSDRKA